MFLLGGVYAGLTRPLPNAVEAAELVDRIVAVVNDEIISLYELNENIKPYLAQIKRNQYSSEQERQMLYTVRQRILEELINQKLASQELKRLKIDVSEKEVDNAIERLKAQRLLTDEELREGLAQQGISYEEYRENVREQVLRAKLVNYEIKSKIVVTREEIKDYYEKHKDSYQTEKKYRLMQIAVTYSAMTDEFDKKRARDQMKSIYRRLEGGAPFEDLIGREADSAVSNESGDLGVYTLEELSPQLQQILKEMESGQYTPIIETSMGLQIIYVAEIIESGGKTLEDVEPEIRNKLYVERVNRSYHAWIEDLKNRSHIKIIN